MVENIPTLELKVSEGFISEDQDTSRLFGYCIESTRGPVLTPTYVSSNAEARRIFGVDFGPHFAQNPTGLILTRIQYPNMKKESLTYTNDVTGEEKDILKIESIVYGKRANPIVVKISQSTLGYGYDLAVSIPEAKINKTFKGVRDIFTIVKRIKNNFSDYITASISNVIECYKLQDKIYKDKNNGEVISPVDGTYLVYDKLTSTFFKYVKSGETNTFTEIDDLVLSSNSVFTLNGGSNGLLGIVASESGSQTCYDDVTFGYKYGNDFYFDSSKKEAVYFAEGVVAVYDNLENKYYKVTTIESQEEETKGQRQTTFEELSSVIELNIDSGKVTEASAIDDSNTIIDGSFDTFNLESVEGLNESSIPIIQTKVNNTCSTAYENGFVAMESIDVVGCSVLSKSPLAHVQLLRHVEMMNDPEINKLRFGVTAYLGYQNGVYNIEEMISDAIDCNNEYIIYIGQGVKYSSPENNVVEILEPYKCVQLYTGIRSHLSYSDAIFGGEQKKVLVNVVDMVPLRQGSVIDLRELLIELNEAGVCTFKKEYGEVTFVEGVTTSDSALLSHEDIMSIVCYVSKQLIAVCKPYQGQKLTEDLKTSLKVSLSDTLKTIQERDGTLISIDEYNIPPYDVEVSSAALVRMNEQNQLVRESKVIVKCKIVPVGALRDIDLGIIVI